MTSSRRCFERFFRGKYRKKGEYKDIIGTHKKIQGIPLNLSLKSTERKVVAIARLDLNSLGILFTSNFE